MIYIFIAIVDPKPTHLTEDIVYSVFDLIIQYI